MADTLKQHKIPGREQLTRPEEIDALKKYLGNIRKIQDEHTHLTEGALEVAGNGDRSYFPELNSLDDSVTNLEGVSGRVSLDNSTTKLPGKNSDITGLDDTIIKGDFKDKLDSLDNSVDTLDTVEKIESLDQTLIKGEISDVTSLDNTRLDLEAEGIKSLDDSVVPGESNKGITISSLNTNIETLEVSETVTLNTTKENLNVSPISGLNDTTERLGVDKVVDSLDNSVREIEVTNVKSLNDARENLYVENRVGDLDDSVQTLSAYDVDSLNDTRDDLYVENRVEDLDNSVQVLDATDSPELNDSVEILDLDKKVTSLDNSKEDLYVDDTVQELSDVRVKLGALDGVKTLDDFVEVLETTPVINSLDNDVVNLKIDELVKGLNNNVSDLEVESLVESLVDAIINLPIDQDKTKIKELLQEVESLNKADSTIFSKVIKVLSDIRFGEDWANKLSSILTEAYLQPEPENLSVSDQLLFREGRYKEFSRKLLEAVGIAEVGIWETKKVSDKLKLSNLGDREKDPDKKGRKYLIPSYQLRPNRLPNLGKGASIESVVTDLTNGTVSLNGMDYVRFGLEKAYDKAGLHGDLRLQILKESLRAARHIVDISEKALGINPDRLPGTSVNKTVGGGKNLRKIVSGLKSAAVMINDTNALTSSIRNSFGAIVDLISGDVSVKNRPEVDEHGNIVAQPYYERANKRVRKIDKGLATGIWDLLCGDSVTDFKQSEQSLSVDYNKYVNFAQNYLYSEGIQTTLLDLCGVSDLPTNFEDLQKILKDSPFITTPGKFGSTSGGVYNSQTLAVTNYWEVVMEPFVNEYMNGGFSYLPAIQEINLINQKKHGINTGYSSWIPFTGFDLTLSKLNTKSVGLYDGEIVYPISNELTNELRLTIADDVYKSWNWYFKTVSDVSVYSSIPHDKYYYAGTSKRYPIAPTYVDKTCHCVALYKNITFRIRIYIMTPQYSTIKSYDLLCVLKDWTTSCTGDVDTAGSGDISLSFSIVGENPDKYVPPVNLIDVTSKGIATYNGDKPEGMVNRPVDSDIESSSPFELSTKPFSLKPNKPDVDDGSLFKIPEFSIKSVNSSGESGIIGGFSLTGN